MKKRNIRINDMVQSKFKSVLKYYKVKQYCINFKLKFSKYSYYLNFKVEKVLIMNHKIPCEFQKFINVFLGKVIKILISHILMDLGINPEFKWLADLIANILVSILNILKLYWLDKHNKS